MSAPLLPSYYAIQNSFFFHHFRNWLTRSIFFEGIDLDLLLQKGIDIVGRVHFVLQHFAVHLELGLASQVWTRISRLERCRMILARVLAKSFSRSFQDLRLFHDPRIWQYIFHSCGPIHEKLRKMFNFKIISINLKFIVLASRGQLSNFLTRSFNRTGQANSTWNSLVQWNKNSTMRTRVIVIVDRDVSE